MSTLIVVWMGGVCATGQLYLSVHLPDLITSRTHLAQWRSERWAWRAAAPRRRPRGGAKILQRIKKNIYKEKFLKFWKNKLKM